MSQEEYIDSLFEDARNQSARLSFEEVAHLIEHASALNSGNSMKKLLIKGLNFNTVLFLILSTSIYLFWRSLSPVDQNYLSDLDIPNLVTTIGPESIDRSISGKETDDAEDLNPSKYRDIYNLLQTLPARSLPIVKQIEKPVLPGITAQRANKIASQGNHRMMMPPTQNVDTRQLAPINVEMTRNLPLSVLRRELNSVEETLNEGREIIFELRCMEPGPSVKIFKDQMMKYDIFTYLELKCHPEKPIVQKLVLQLKHPQGLNWDMKVWDFELLELKLHLNEKGYPLGMAYRIDRQYNFSKPILIAGTRKSKFRMRRGNGKEN